MRKEMMYMGTCLVYLKQSSVSNFLSKIIEMKVRKGKMQKEEKKGRVKGEKELEREKRQGEKSKVHGIV